jgi:hypothetical protein
MGVLANCVIVGIALEIDGISWPTQLALVAIPLILFNAMWASLLLNGVISLIRARKQESSGGNDLRWIGETGPPQQQQHIKATMSQKIVGTALLVPVVGIAIVAGHFAFDPILSSYNWLLGGALRAGAVLAVIAMVVCGYHIARVWYE